MAKAKEDKSFSYNIESYIGSLKESTTHDWAKAVLRMSWNDNPVTLDIRSVNMAQKRIGKGISLSNEEVDKLVSILLDEGYGTMEDLENAIKKKRNFFSIANEIDDMLDDGMYNIDIK